MKIVIFVMFTVLFFVSNGHSIEINKDEVLTLNKAISIALLKHPDIKSAEGTVKVYESRVGQSKSDYYPDINLTSAITRHSTGSNDLNFNSSINLSQNIYDFGKREARLDINLINLNSSKEDLQFTRLQVIYNVKKAYYFAIQAKSALEVARYVVKQYLQHLSRAKGFYEAGTKPKYEVTKAEVDLASSRVNLIKAENNFKLAITNLKNAIGIYNVDDFMIHDEAIIVYDMESLDDLINKAFLNRQDYRSIELKERSQQKRIEFEKSGYYPSISANAKYGYSGDRFPLEKNWLVGANLTFPIFTGFQTKYQVDEAVSSLSVIQSQKEALRQRIVLEVRQAYLNAKDARERLDSSEITLRYAEENFQLATGRYEAGVGSPIEVTDAITVYSNARNSYIDAKYDLLTAIADIMRATGLEPLGR